jgi:NitT/TauT family transport system substrate-binding protein
MKDFGGRDMQSHRLIRSALAAAALLGAISAAHAEEIAVAQYGSSVSGMPWVIALEKGFFRDAGADVTGIRGSTGGSTEIRNMIAGELAYADTGLAAVISAARSGAELKIVNENSHTTAQFVWIAMPNSTVKALADIKGKRLTFTTPLSTSQALDFMLVNKAGLTVKDVTLTSTGAYGAALTALQSNGVDIALVAEPVFTLNKDKFRPVFWSRELFPAINNTIGITSPKIARERPDVLRGIILAHRRAIEFMGSDRKESAARIAKVYKLDPAVVEHIIGEMMDLRTIDGMPFYSPGNINPKDMDAMVEGLRLIGALQGSVQWRDLVDQSFLPDDLKRKLD